MSGISKNIRKITKAWGGETTGSGIGDAIRDLYDSLPFSSRFEEEIISNQVRESGESTSSVIDMELAKAILDYPEKVVITKNTMNGPKVYKLGEITSDNGNTITWDVPDPYGEGWHNNIAGKLSINLSTGKVETGYNALGSYTLTISVTVPVEVVKKLDPKFLPSDNVVYANLEENEGEDGNITYTCDKTFEELLELLKNGKKIKLSFYGEIYDYNTYSISEVLPDDKHNSVCFMRLGVNNGFYVYANGFWICKSGNIIHESASLALEVESDLA